MENLGTENISSLQVCNGNFCMFNVRIKRAKAKPLPRNNVRPSTGNKMRESMHRITIRRAGPSSPDCLMTSSIIKPEVIKPENLISVANMRRNIK